MVDRDSHAAGGMVGALTGACADRVRRLQSADGGTLFLDEVGNLPLQLQPKLLTALEQRRITPVGTKRPMAIDILLSSATNMVLAGLAAERAVILAECAACALADLPLGRHALEAEAASVNDLNLDRGDGTRTIARHAVSADGKAWPLNAASR